MNRTRAARRCLWLLIAALAVAQAASFTALGLQFKLREIVLIVLGSLAALGLSAFYGTVRPDPRLSRLLRGAVEFVLLSFICGSLSYAASSLGRPLWDATFHAWDQQIGFDWRYWLAVVDAHPAVHHGLALAYHSMLPQFAVLILLLATIRANATLDTLLLAYGLAALVTVAIAAVMPAVSPLVFLEIKASDHPNIELAVPLQFAEQIAALREGSLRLIDLSGAHGLVTFPSFHTVGALLLIAGFRRVPVVRWVALPLNGVMLVSIPIEGSHYLVDVIAGAAVAAAAWLSAGFLIERAARQGGPVRAALSPAPAS